MGSFWVFGTILGAEKREDVKTTFQKKNVKIEKKPDLGAKISMQDFFEKVKIAKKNEDFSNRRVYSTLNIV